MPARRRKNILLIGTKTLVISILASLLQLFIICVLKDFSVLVIGTIIFIIPGMLWFGFRDNDLGIFLKRLFLSYSIAVACGGLLNIATSWNSKATIPAWSIFLVLVVAKKIILYLTNCMRRKCNLYHVLLCNKDKRMETLALWDTGNQLVDQKTLRPVHIVSKQIIEQLKIAEPENYGEIQYQSLGKMDGRLTVYEIEKMHIYEGKKQKTLESVLVACDKDNLLQNRQYQMILNVEGVGI